MNSDYINKTLTLKTKFLNQNFVDYDFTKTNFNSAVFEIKQLRNGIENK